MINSTLRFNALFDGVSLGATGFVSPIPPVSIVDALIPKVFTSSFFTTAALCPYVFAMIYDEQEGYFAAKGRREGPVTNYSCGVKDMATGKLYQLPYLGGNYNKVIKKYINRLEEIRIMNEGSK